MTKNFIIIIFMILYVSPHLLSYTIKTPSRRILHPSFLPSESPPPADSPTPPPPSPPPPYPFTSTTTQPPFFPDYSSPLPPSPPSPPPPESPTTTAADISSLSFPHAPKPKPNYPIITVAAVCSAVALFLIVAGILYSRQKKSSRGSSADDSGNNGENAEKGRESSHGVSRVPKLRAQSTPSSEFLYLGTLVNSRSVDKGITNDDGKDQGLGARRLDSPELRPLPPLIGRTCCDQEDEFHSPNRVSLDGGSDGECVQNNNDGSSSCSGSSSSSLSSANRFHSSSISPAVSLSPQRLHHDDDCLNDGKVEKDNDVSLRMWGVDVLFSPEDKHGALPRGMEVSDHEYMVFSSVSSSPGRVVDVNLNRREMYTLSSSVSESPERVVEEGTNVYPKFVNSVVQNEDLDLQSSSGCTASGEGLDTTSRLSDVESGSNQPSSAAAPSPPLPPPPPPMRMQSRRRWEVPSSKVTSCRVMSGPPSLICPSRPFIVPNSAKGLTTELPPSHDNLDNNEDVPKPKLKRLHWDKVRASSDRDMVWDHLRSNSFKLNEERFETLFVVNTPISKPKDTTLHTALSLPGQANAVLDPKKSQNIAILLRALNVTIEEVCDALLEGNADLLGTELLESLLKMAPTKEEEHKLKDHKDNSPVKLGPAEKFLKAVLNIPFAFKRMDALLYIANFESEVEYLRKSYETLEAACEELRSSRMFLKLLEAVLKTGNRMNVGTVRGDAHAIKLDALLKLVDVKGADGKTTLLHFVVQEIIKAEGARLSRISQTTNPTLLEDVKCRKLGLEVVSHLCSELSNVKKAAAMDSDVLSNDVSKLSRGIGKIREVLQLNGNLVSNESTKKFSESMNEFMNIAEMEIVHIQAQERFSLSLVKEITEYFHGSSATDEAHPFRIFMVVREFLTTLSRVCKEVGAMNEQTIANSVHKYAIPMNTTPPQVFVASQLKAKYNSSDDESSS